MFRAFLIASGLLVTATPLLADWSFRPSKAWDDTGSVQAQNPQGHVLQVSCGNGGFVGISLRPDLRPANRRSTEHAILQLRVDQRPPLFLPVTCGDHGCDQASLNLGKPFTAAEVEAIIRDLRTGSLLEISLGAQPMSQFSLRGSSAALGKLKEVNQNCDGL